MIPEEILQSALERVGEGHVILRVSHTQNLRWANSAITTNGDTSTVGLSVVAVRESTSGTRLGVASGHVDGPRDAAELADRAAEQAASTPPTDAAALIDAGADPDGTSAPATVPAATTEALVSAVGTMLASGSRQFGYAEADTSTTYLHSSTGTRYRHVLDTVRFEASARDATGSTWFGANNVPADLDAVVAAQAEALAVQAHREELRPGRHRVLLTPSAVADLLIYLAWSANGRDAVEGHNVFSAPGGGTRIGQRLTERDLTLYADPAEPGLQCADRVVVDVNGSMESAFDNGLHMPRQELISRGVLSALRIGRPAAATIGLPPVYLADNLVLTDGQGAGTPGQLLERTGDAVLINCLWYIREVDPQNLLLTGLTRDGVYRVRDGRITGALPNFRFNVSVPELLAEIADASNAVPTLPREWADWFNRTRMPALLVDGFNLSSPSEAL